MGDASIAIAINTMQGTIPPPLFLHVARIALDAAAILYPRMPAGFPLRAVQTAYLYAYFSSGMPLPQPLDYIQRGQHFSMIADYLRHTPPAASTHGTSHFRPCGRVPA